MRWERIKSTANIRRLYEYFSLHTMTRELVRLFFFVCAYIIVDSLRTCFIWNVYIRLLKNGFDIIWKVVQRETLEYDYGIYFDGTPFGTKFSLFVLTDQFLFEKYFFHRFLMYTMHRNAIVSSAHENQRKVHDFV